MNEHIDRRPALIKAVNNHVNDMANRLDWASRTYLDWERRVRENDMSSTVALLTPGPLRGGLRWSIFGSRKFVQAEGLIFSAAAVLTGGRDKKTFNGKA